MGKAPAITRRDSSATLPARVRSFEVKLSLRAYAKGPCGYNAYGRWMSSILGPVLIDTARDVLVLSSCTFGATLCGIFDK